jgi:hypothetical protein
VKPEESTCTVELLIVGSIAVIEALTVLTVAAIALALTLLSYARPHPIGFAPHFCGAKVHPIDQSALPAVHPLAELLQPLTCSELRALLGIRSRSVSKLHLQAALIA